MNRWVIGAVVVVGAVIALLQWPPLSLAGPSALGPGDVLEVAAPGLATKVEILVDERGVPHVFAPNEAGAVFGLGFMHARDRLFQLDLLRHAAHGRLTELFGAEMLDTDRRLRLLGYQLDAQLAALGDRDRALLEAYAAGVNAGAVHVERGLEHWLLRRDFAPFAARDSLALVRLQAWDLSVDMTDELRRATLVARAGADDPRVAALLAPMDAGGAAIVSLTDGAMAPARVEGAPPSAPTHAPEQPAPQPAREQGRIEPFAKPQQRHATNGWLDELSLGGRGASNSWAVEASHTSAGKSVLCNDPHLRHTLPSVFYLAHLSTPDADVVGATFPGIPAVLIGAGKSLAWGMTTSYADSQDLLRLTSDTERGVTEAHDGLETLVRWRERFVLTDGTAHDEERLATRAGPVVPTAFAGAELGPYALRWGGFVAGGPNASVVSGFWDLYRARSTSEVDAAVSQLSITSQNVAFVLADGTIGYRLAAPLQRRAAGVTGQLPQSYASLARPGESTFVALHERPSLTRPERGFLVAANQPVVETGDSRRGLVGLSGAEPYRAQRAGQRIAELVGGAGRAAPSPEQLCALQQDSVSLEARALAPIFARHCPTVLEGHPEALVSWACRALREFDGDFSVSSQGALLYTTLLADVRRELLRTLAAEADLDDLAESGFARAAVTRALVVTATGAATPLIAPHGATPSDALGAVMARALRRTLDTLTPLAANGPDAWEWGKAHELAPAGPLARAPLVGDWFRAPAVPEAGHGTALRAESGLPVQRGAALRMLAVASEPVAARFVLDTGQSGAAGSPHWLDQRDAWSRGELFELVRDHAKLVASEAARINLTPTSP